MAQGKRVVDSFAYRLGAFCAETITPKVVLNGFIYFLIGCFLIHLRCSDLEEQARRKAISACELPNSHGLRDTAYALMEDVFEKDPGLTYWLGENCHFARSYGDWVVSRARLLKQEATAAGLHPATGGSHHRKYRNRAIDEAIYLLRAELVQKHVREGTSGGRDADTVFYLRK